MVACLCLCCATLALLLMLLVMHPIMKVKGLEVSGKARTSCLVIMV